MNPSLEIQDKLKEKSRKPKKIKRIQIPKSIQILEENTQN